MIAYVPNGTTWVVANIGSLSTNHCDYEGGYFDFGCCFNVPHSYSQHTTTSGTYYPFHMTSEGYMRAYVDLHSHIYQFSYLYPTDPEILLGTARYSSMANLSPVYSNNYLVKYWNSSNTAKQEGLWNIVDRYNRTTHLAAGTVNCHVTGSQSIITQGAYIDDVNTWYNSTTFIYTYDGARRRTNAEIITLWNTEPIEPSANLQVLKADSIKDSILYSEPEPSGLDTNTFIIKHPLLKINRSKVTKNFSYLADSISMNEIGVTGLIPLETIERKKMWWDGSTTSQVTKALGGANLIEDSCLSFNFSWTIFDLYIKNSNVYLNRQRTYDSSFGGVQLYDEVKLVGVEGYISSSVSYTMPMKLSLSNLRMGTGNFFLWDDAYNATCCLDFEMHNKSQEPRTEDFEIYLNPSSVQDYSYHKVVFNRCTFADVDLLIRVSAEDGYTPPKTASTASNAPGEALPFIILIQDFDIDPEAAPETQPGVWAWTGPGLKIIDIKYGVSEVENPKNLNNYGIPTNNFTPLPIEPISKARRGGVPLNSFINETYEYGQLFGGATGSPELYNGAVYSEYVDGTDIPIAGIPCLNN